MTINHFIKEKIDMIKLYSDSVNYSHINVHYILTCMQLASFYMLPIPLIGYESFILVIS